MAKDELDLPRIVKIAREFSRPYRIDRGATFRLKDVDPGDTGSLGSRGQVACAGGAGGRPYGAGRVAGPLVRAGPLVGAPHLPGHGRRGQGRRDQARDVGHQSAGMPGVLVQGADAARSSTTTTCGAASMDLPERGRIGIFNRSYYEEVLVVKVHPEYLDRAEAAAAAGRQGHLGPALPGHPRLRALPRAQRHAGPQVLPQRLARRAEEALPRAHRAAGEELEVLRGATCASAGTGTTTWRRTRG